MLAEADDFWPGEVSEEVQEILSAVIAFKEPRPEIMGDGWW